MSSGFCRQYNGDQLIRCTVCCMHALPLWSSLYTTQSFVLGSGRKSTKNTALRVPPSKVTQGHRGRQGSIRRLTSY